MQWDESSGWPGLVKIHNTVKFKAVLRVYQVLGQRPRKDEDNPSLQPAVLRAEEFGHFCGRGGHRVVAPVILHPVRDGDTVPHPWGIFWATAGGVQGCRARPGLREEQECGNTRERSCRRHRPPEIGEREGKDQISSDTSWWLLPQPRVTACSVPRPGVFLPPRSQTGWKLSWGSHVLP